MPGEKEAVGMSLENGTEVPEEAGTKANQPLATPTPGRSRPSASRRARFEAYDHAPAAELPRRGDDDGAGEGHEKFPDDFEVEEVDLKSLLGDASPRRAPVGLNYEQSGSESADMLFAKGLGHQDRGELDKAAKCFKRVLEIDSSFADAQNSLGMVYLHKGMMEEGVRALEATLALDPYYAEAYANLGFAHRRMGNDTEAAAFYAKYLELEPDAEDRPKIMWWLSRGKASRSPLPPVAHGAGAAPADPTTSVPGKASAASEAAAENVAGERPSGSRRKPEPAALDARQRKGSTGSRASRAPERGEPPRPARPEKGEPGSVPAAKGRPAGSGQAGKSTSDESPIGKGSNTASDKGAATMEPENGARPSPPPGKADGPRVEAAPEDSRRWRPAEVRATPKTVVYRTPFGRSEDLGGSTVPAAEGVPDTQFARLAVESGLASPNDIGTCLEMLDHVHDLGLHKTLADVMVERGFLTANQASAIAAAAGSGDAGGLLGGFQLLEKLGEGGMGTVYKARQVSLDRLVALKILSEHFASDREFVARFEREAKTAAKLSHPHIVGAVDVGKAAGKYYFAMEFIDGRSVKNLLEERGKLPETEALQIIIQMAKALAYAWRNGMVHRDVKPDNIILAKDNVAKLADLGLAKQIEQAGETRLTRVGAGMGTPHYIAPEQALGGEVDIRADIYSLGVTFYEMTVGRLPFTGEDAMAIIMGRFTERPEPADKANPEVSRNAADVIDVMMAHDADARYPDPRVLLHDLLLVAAGKKPEFASASKSRQVRAIRKAEKLDVRAHTSIVVRRRSSKGVVAAGAAVTAVVVGLSVVLVLSLSGEEAPARIPAALAATDAAQTKKREQLAAEAGDHYARVEKIVAEGEYEKALGEVSSLGLKYAETEYHAKLQALKLEAVGKIDKAKRIAADEAEKNKRYAELVKLARDELAVGDYATALGLLGQAKGVKETEEAAELVAKARRIQHLSRAQDAERAGKLREALRLYRLALAIGGDPKLRERVAQLKRKADLAEMLATAGRLAGEGRWAETKMAYGQALSLARGPERAKIEQKTGLVEKEIRYSGEMDQARRALRDKAWKEALSHAQAALAVKAGDGAAQNLVERARDALGPEPEITNSIGMRFVLVPAGRFPMGSDRGNDDERPAREVHLDAYYIGRFEVTNAQFERFRPGHRSKWKQYSPGDRTPAIAITWEEAAAFCRWLSQKEGAKYRLPTEAEWERAARGSDGRLFPWGYEAPRVGDREYRCNFAPGKARELWRRDGFEFASPVGSFPAGASAHGCHDMAGNVWEWCLDWYAADFYANGARRNPTGPAAGQKKVLRGGSFTNQASTLRCTNRLAKPPHFYEANLGFRCVRAVRKRKTAALELEDEE